MRIIFIFSFSFVDFWKIKKKKVLCKFLMWKIAEKLLLQYSLIILIIFVEFWTNFCEKVFNCAIIIVFITYFYFYYLLIITLLITLLLLLYHFAILAFIITLLLITTTIFNYYSIAFTYLSILIKLFIKIVKK